MSRLSYLRPILREGLALRNGAPLLTGALETSLPNLHVIGLPSAPTFGPVMRFMFGAKHASAILARHIGKARNGDFAVRPPAMLERGAGVQT
jgi:hypothetical protein